MKAPAFWKTGRALERHPLRAITVGIAVLAAAVALLASGGGDDDRGANARGRESGGDPLSALRAGITLPKLGLNAPDEPSPVPGPRYPIAQVRTGEEVAMREVPGGPVIETVGDRTEFGSDRYLWVAEIRGDWLGVPAPELPNGRLGWIRDDRTKLNIYETSYWIIADVSERMLELRYGKEVLDRFPVTVGSPGSPTPLGAYSVTDGLAGGDLGPYYGCCVLALSGHQPNLPPDWIGGDRIAIHGTPGATGQASSSGCLRASDPDMVSLFARVPLGTPVFVQA